MSRQRRLIPVKDSLLVVHWVSCFLATTPYFLQQTPEHYAPVYSKLCVLLLLVCVTHPPPPSGSSAGLL